MSVLMKGLPLDLKMYLRRHKLPDVYEALLTGLTVMCPDDPLQFILDKLRQIDGYDAEDLNLQWDMFVAESMKPVNRIITDSNLDYIFNLDDENSMPTPEMYGKAYGFYNLALKKLCFRAWMQFYLQKLQKHDDQHHKMRVAARHHVLHALRVHVQIWKDWVKYRKGRQAMAFQKLEHICHVSVGRVIFDAWHNHTLDAKRQREYFERLERGETVEEDTFFYQNSGEARDSISTLPRKVAIQIFSYVDLADLARCACVCRSWKVISQASLLWSRIDLHRVRQRLPEGVTDKVAIRLLSKCRPYLMHLNLRGCDMLGQSTFITLSECRNLQDLNLSECDGLDDDSFKKIVRGCKILLYLNISHTNLTDASLRTIAKYCMNLQCLSLAYCTKFSDKGLQYLAVGKSKKTTEYLDLSGCLQITPSGFGTLASGLTNLKTLILDEFPTLADDSVMAIAEKCINLQHVSILGSPLLTDEPLKKMAQNKKLKVIKLESNHRISDASIKAIGRLCPNLEHVYLADCQRLTDASLKALAVCKNLAVLNVADCVRISDTGVRYLTDGPCAPRLREVNLTNCVRVGDMAIVNLHKRCYNLAYLTVSYCDHISEAGIELLGQTHCLTSLDLSGCNCGDVGLSALGNNFRLRDLTISECANITDLGLQKFAQQCREIERIDLSHCLNITDGAIKNLAFCCRMINSLNLAGCKAVTDMSIQYLSGVCYYLSYLDISGCVLISDKSMKYLRKGCKKLRVLIMNYCQGITKSSAQKMLRHVEVVEYNADAVPRYFGY